MKLFTRRALCALLSAALVAGALPMGAMADTGQGSSPPSQTAQQEDAPAPQETAPLEGTAPEESATPAPTEGTEGEGAQEPAEECPEEPAEEPAEETPEVSTSQPPQEDSQPVQTETPDAPEAPAEEPSEETDAPAQEPAGEEPPAQEPAEEEPPGAQPDGETGALTLLPQEWAEQYPIATLAAEWRPGEVVSTFEGGAFTSADGRPYATQSFYFVRYYADGTREIKRSVQGSSFVNTKYYIGSASDPQNAYLAYCIESGVAFDGGDYSSSDSEVSNYMRLLTPIQQDGIMLAMLYGFKPYAHWDLPSQGEVGCAFNVDDFAFATQIIIWEYQAGIRTSPTRLTDLTIPGGTHTTIPANNYVQWIEGRPAKYCYDYILNQMANHGTVPSFATDNRNQTPPTHTMAYNAAAGVYSVTLTDTNNTGIDLKVSGAPGVTVTRSGNKYTFTSSSPITSGGVTCTAQKDLPHDTPNMLIWSNSGKQTLATGAEDPVRFYFRLETQATASLHLYKFDLGNVSGSGRLAGAVYELLEYKGSNYTDGAYIATGKYATSDANGYLFFDGLAYTTSNLGLYRIVEVSAPTGYEVDTAMALTINVATGTWRYASSFFWAEGKAGDSLNIDVNGDGQPDGGLSVEQTASGYKFVARAFDQPKVGALTVCKRDAATGQVLAGAVYELYEYKGTNHTDGEFLPTGKLITTGADGLATFEGLTYTTSNLGYFKVREVSAPDGYALDASFYTLINIQSGAWRHVSQHSWATGNAKDNPKATVDIGGTERTILEVSASGSSYRFTTHAYNTRLLGGLQIHKVDGATGGNLAGVKLALYTADGKPVSFAQQADGSYAAQMITGGVWATPAETTELITDAAGLVTVGNLPYGTYTLAEVQTQAGYVLLPEPITITVDGTAATVSLRLANHQGYELPRTGGPGLGLTALGVCAVAAIFTWTITKPIRPPRKRTEKEN